MDNRRVRINCQLEEAALQVKVGEKRVAESREKVDKSRRDSSVITGMRGSEIDIEVSAIRKKAEEEIDRIRDATLKASEKAIIKEYQIISAKTISSSLSNVERKLRRNFSNNSPILQKINNIFVEIFFPILLSFLATPN